MVTGARKPSTYWPLNERLIYLETIMGLKNPYACVSVYPIGTPLARSVDRNDVVKLATWGSTTDVLL
jgi:hypothetical protein